MSIRVENTKARRLWLYWDKGQELIWAPSKPYGPYIRVAHKGHPAPKGYHKPNGELAFDAVEKIPTMRDLVHALTP